MKRIILIGVLFLAFIPEKQFTVTLSQKEWVNTVNTLELTKQILKKSDLPVKVVLPLIDSLTVIQNRFITQITDSTKK